MTFSSSFDESRRALIRKQPPMLRNLVFRLTVYYIYTLYNVCYHVHSRLVTCVTFYKVSLDAPFNWVVGDKLNHDQRVCLFPNPDQSFCQVLIKHSLMVPPHFSLGIFGPVIHGSWLRTKTKKCNLEISYLTNSQTLCKRAFLRFFFANFTRALMCLLQARGSTGCSKRLPFQIDGGHCALGNFQSTAFFCGLPENSGSCSTGTSFDFMVLFYSCIISRETSHRRRLSL